MARAALAKSCERKPPDSKWFDGYDGQEVLILNDLRKSTFTFSYLLDLLDRYEFRVEVKNGYAPMLAKVIVVTCSKSHAELWAELGGTTNENLGQLTRRFRIADQIQPHRPIEVKVLQFRHGPRIVCIDNFRSAIR